MKNIFELFDQKYICGRMISGSKSGYSNKFPKNIVFFNANIFSDDGKIWWGDIDLTKDWKIIKEISQECNSPLYVLSEHEGRFENEEREDFKSAAVWNTETGFSEKYKKYVDIETMKYK